MMTGDQVTERRLQASAENVDIELGASGTDTGRRQNDSGGVATKYDPIRVRRRLGNASEVPEYVPVRPFIRNYYRINYTFADCFWSIFALHNETVNIWSHLIGFCIWLRQYAAIRQDDIHNKADEFTQTSILLSYCLCLFMPLFSTIYHSFYSSVSCGCIFDYTKPGTGSSAVQLNLLRLDLFGILCLWFSRLFLEGHYVWWCDRGTFYNVMMISSLLFIYCSFVLLRDMNLLALGPLFILAHIPLISMVLFGLQTAPPSPDLSAHLVYSISGTVCAFVAFYVYKKNLPERWKPGYFDLFGSSHNIWHVFVWLGPTLVMRGFVFFLRYRVVGAGGKCGSTAASMP
jgi:adiponectin receptor